METEQTTTWKMDFNNITVKVHPADARSLSLPMKFRLTEEKNREYTMVAAEEDCGVSIRCTVLPGCCIWHVRFAIHKKTTVAITGPGQPCTFLWAMWKNNLYYEFDNMPEGKLPLNYYNLYHLPRLNIKIRFQQSGEYETFNITFSNLRFDTWPERNYEVDLPGFQRKIARNKYAILSPRHRELSDNMQNVITTMLRGPLHPAKRHGFYEKNIEELMLYLLHDLSIPDYAFANTLRPVEIDKIEELGNMISKHPGEHYRLDNLAEQAGMTRGKLEQVFQAIYEVSVFTFVHHQQMKKAKQLLQGTTLSIKEIAAETGYKNQSSFTTAFKKFYGKPPSRMRKM